MHTRLSSVFNSIITWILLSNLFTRISFNITLSAICICICNRYTDYIICVQICNLYTKNQPCVCTVYCAYSEISIGNLQINIYRMYIELWRNLILFSKYVEDSCWLCVSVTTFVYSSYNFWSVPDAYDCVQYHWTSWWIPCFISHEFHVYSFIRIIVYTHTIVYILIYSLSFSGFMFI